MRTVAEIRAAGGPKTVEELVDCFGSADVGCGFTLSHIDGRCPDVNRLALYVVMNWSLNPVLRPGDTLAFAPCGGDNPHLRPGAVVFAWWAEADAFAPAILMGADRAVCFRTYESEPVAFDGAEIVAVALGHEWELEEQYAHTITRSPLPIDILGLPVTKAAEFPFSGVYAPKGLRF